MSSSTKISRVLIANRGEIAVRVIKACHSMGIETVAVYSDADTEAAHVRMANTSVYLGGEAAADSYLNIDKIIHAAKSSDADAIHPGYGFLSENPLFVERCDSAGITFIGPSAEAMRSLGDKARAKDVAKKADVPTVPEWEPDSVPTDAYPVLVKAAAGGGGRGMRRVANAAALPEAIESAKREAAAGFGDDTLLVEKLVTNARHIEVQLLADQHGNALYIGDRDCSLQRRHQKVVEEAPAPNLSPELRIKMGEAAVRLAKEAGYYNAGTVEFLVTPDEQYYLLELNARLQVEHPVTEQAFNIDLVRWQLRIAQGEELTLTQEDVICRSHSIEVRLYAEDPVSFLPTGGTVLKLTLPKANEGIRIDHALQLSDEVSLAYDPLLAKVISTSSDRESARQALIHALKEVSLLGVITNSALLQHALQLHDFASCTHNTSTLENNLLSEDAVNPQDTDIDLARSRATTDTKSQDPFNALGKWRVDNLVSVNNKEARTLDTVSHGDTVWFSRNGVSYETSRDQITPSAKSASITDNSSYIALTAPMPGSVLKVLAQGTEVSAGQPVVVLEAMKMETALTAPFDGKVLAASVAVGDLVKKGAVLAEVER